MNWIIFLHLERKESINQRTRETEEEIEDEEDPLQVKATNQKNSVVRIRAQNDLIKYNFQEKKTDQKDENNLAILTVAGENLQKRKIMTEKSHLKEEKIAKDVEIIEVGAIPVENHSIIKEENRKINVIVEKINVNLVKNSLITRKSLPIRRKETIKVSETLRKSSFLVRESVN
tara:strand:+ start:121 stop:642 length:522 start_codon:yes stop_codon:yes gene_type:complete